MTIVFNDYYAILLGNLAMISLAAITLRGTVREGTIT